MQAAQRGNAPDDLVYLNNAGTSWPKPAAVHAAVADALSASPEEHSDLLAGAHQEVCDALGIATPERFLFTQGCTSALAVALADLPWEDGDVVLTSALEHEALLRPVRALAAHGVRHETAPLLPDAPIDLDFVAAQLKTGRVRVVAVTAASNVTGECLPTDEIVALAHAHGALVVLDGAQAVGTIPLDVGVLDVDIFAFAGHKGPLGPQGIGGLWFSPGVAFRSTAAACTLDGETDEGSQRGPGYCDVGSVNLAAACGLAAGMHELRASDTEVGRNARALRAALHEALSERPVCCLHRARHRPHTATLAFEVDGLPLDQAERHFRQHRVLLRAGLHCAESALAALGAAQGVLRASFGPFNREEDVARVCRAVDSIASL